MTGIWLDGFERVDGNDSGPFADAPFRLVLHTTEGGSVDGAIGAFRTNNSWPHFTVDVVKRRKVQHLRLDRGGRALMNLPGGVETNRERAVQIELVGYAAHTQDWTDADLEWLALDVFEPIMAATGIGTDHPVFVGADQSPASAHAKQRMSFEQWQTFAGICGHQHVPENDHWDPGRFPIDRALSFLGDPPAPIPVPTPPPTEDDTMKLRQPQGGSDDGKIFLVGPATYRYISDQGRLKDLEAEFGPVTPINPVAWGDLKGSLDTIRRP